MNEVNPAKPMRVLIVGCGYVGVPLGAELVRQGHEVFGLRRSRGAAEELKSAGIQPLLADITRPDELAKLPCDFDWVVNCAAAGGGGAENYRQVYLAGTKNLIEWLSNSPLKKFIYTSSTSVYGQNDGSIVTEKSLAQPDADTAKVLVETEKLLAAAAQNQNFPAIIVRVAGIYGPERGHLFKQFLRGDAGIDGDGARWLNMIHRDDLIGVIGAALKHGQPGEIYNAADDEPVSQLDFLTWLAAALGKNLPPTAPENPGARKRGATNKRVANLKLKTELGYAFKHPSFREGYGAEISRLGLR